jgi:ABC-type multidrug transport system ATPase subunit
MQPLLALFLTLTAVVILTIYSPEDAIIVVMGMTGAGKSTFISHCTKEPQPEGIDGLLSCKNHLCIGKSPT